MTKQSQRDEFIKKFCPHNTDPVLRIYADYFLQKQDQLLTELGESLEKEKMKPTEYHGKDCELGKRPCMLEQPNHPLADRCEITKHTEFNEGLDKAITLINKYK